MKRLMILFVFALMTIGITSCKVHKKPNDEALANLSLPDQNNDRHPIINKESKVNMLIFWASWCGPCREEIPSLKKVYAKYQAQGLNMVSISIDEDKASWHMALQQEIMDWPQYIIDPDKLKEANKIFNFSAIPLVVFADSSGHQFKRFVGSGPNQNELFSRYIDRKLAEISNHQ